ncbi:hypothetical protein FAI41_04775 [Acetobacteraceae bacterium]|nr:hypothetical protein FAI41_04775 [Acetobacteraceae bacterium]
MNGLDIKQFKNLVIRPALEKIELSGDNAVNLLLGTALAESGLTYLQQIDSGPALGLFQMESATHDDIWENYLKFHPELLKKVQMITNIEKGDASLMISNLTYAVILCRLCYLRAKDPLPAENDAISMAVYHKVHYNTQNGKADAKRNIPLFQEAINA